VPDLRVTPDNLMVVSPDEGAMGRAVYLANIIGVDMGMFYKRRDYTRLVNGRNPIVAHEFLGTDVRGKDVIVVDDMISSGDSMLDVCRQLKDRGAARVIVCCTFGLFTNGLAAFDEYYEKGLMYRLITTNLVYQDPELLKRDYFINVDMSKYMSYIIDSLNHDVSISDLLDPSAKIKTLIQRYNKGELSNEDIDKLE
jgi:ribose-phosphate pyrophosphokinase